MRARIWPALLLIALLAAGCSPTPGAKIKNNARVPVMVRVYGPQTRGMFGPQTTDLSMPVGGSKDIAGDSSLYIITAIPIGEWIPELETARGMLIQKRDFGAENLTPQDTIDISNHIGAVEARMASLFQEKPGATNYCTIHFPEDQSCGGHSGIGTATVEQKPDGSLVVTCISPTVTVIK
ncbi:MAG: hypothetical protein WCF84_25495 [Anaerolineae bacterium]